MEMEIDNKYSEVIDSIRKYFNKQHITCPDFFDGSLRDACRSAFSSARIEEHRPVLVYVHHEKDVYTKSICSHILSSISTKHYVVWAWNIESKSNEQLLRDMWNGLLLDLPWNNCSKDVCSMLIGIRRCLPKRNIGIILSEYEYEILFHSNACGSVGALTSVQEITNRLANFKQKSDQRERILAFDFIANTGLSWEIVLEITKYMTLNEAIIVFSNKILPLLNQYQVKLQILNPTLPYIKTISQQMLLENIISVLVETKTVSNKFDYHSLADLKNIRSLTLLNFYDFKYFEKYQHLLPNLRRLSLYYDQVFSFQLLENLIESVQIPIKRLDIRFTEMHCTKLVQDLFNDSIEHFVIDISDLTYSLKSENCNGIKYKFLTNLFDLIYHIRNIRRLRLIIKQQDVDQLLDRKQWKTLLKICRNLKSIRIQVTNGFHQKGLMLDIQNDFNIAFPLVKIRFELI